MDAKLKRMDPSVQCSDNLMTLKVRRVRDAHFLVDSGERPLTPLSRMPPKCGFSVKRTRRDVQFAASYQGCHVTQQDGDYVLPLRLWGAPMTMSCPAVLPSPSVFCFASGMVVKISGVTADELKVKDINPAVETVAPLSDSDQVLQHPQYHQLPMFPQYFQPMPTNTPDPSEDTVAPLPHPQFYSGAPADYTNENQDVPAAENREFPFMPQFHQYPFLPDPEPPTQSSAGENTADPLAQYPQMQQSPHYQYSDFPQFPMEPEIFHPTTPAPPLATSTEALVTPPAPAMEVEGNPQVPEQQKFPVPHPYPLLSFPKHPPSLKDQAQATEDTKFVIQLPKPQHMHPQSYQIPVMYPSPNNPPQRQNTPTAAPTAIPPTASTAASQKPTAQKSFYHPHPYIPVYYIPQQADMPVFPDPPTTPPDSPAPSDQPERQPAYGDMPPFLFLSHENPKPVGRER
nr:PREDICTED: vegetative cell wall protein gp1-like [Stegastes partitus]